jgi:hypothetical protein
MKIYDNTGASASVVSGDRDAGKLGSQFSLLVQALQMAKSAGRNEQQYRERAVISDMH